MAGRGAQGRDTPRRERPDAVLIRRGALPGFGVRLAGTGLLVEPHRDECSWVQAPPAGVFKGTENP